MRVCSLRMLLDLNAVSKPAHRFNFKIGNIRQMLAKSPDMHIHRSLVALAVRAPHGLNQLAARHDLPGIGQQVKQQIKFPARQIQLPLAHAHRAGSRIHAGLPHADDLPGHNLCAAQERAESTVANAEAKASRMLDEARAQAEEMVSETEIMQKAREEARTTVNQALAEASDKRLAAAGYADGLLDELDKLLTEMGNHVRSKRSELAE